MARIGIDARFWSQSGIGRYIRNLVFHLQKIDHKNEYFLFLLKKDFDDSGILKNFNKIPANFGWYGISEQIKFPHLLNKYNLDLVHFPHFNVPVLYKGRFIVTVHDLIHQNFRMRRATTLNPLIYGIKQFGYNKIFNNALFKSQKIIVPSNFVKEQLVKKREIPDNKIVVTNEGVDEKILKMKNQISKIAQMEMIRKLKIKPPYIFYVGNAHPHKNIEGLIKAFVRVKGQGSPVKRGYARVKDLQLVLAGYDHYFWERIKKVYQVSSIKYQGEIIFTGAVSDEELVSLYKNAQCFVMPSFEEGFGIPILEAMACGCPVVSSNAGSLTEIGGDACIYFDPKSIADMAEKILQVIDDKKLKRELIEKGNKRYKMFSWERLSKETLDIYRQSI